MLVHDYFTVDLGSVWDTVADDIPKLKKGVKKILEKFPVRENLDHDF